MSSTMLDDDDADADDDPDKVVFITDTYKI